MATTSDKMSKFVDRLKTVVNTAQSAVNTARNVVAENLMGNPVCREYEIIKHVASAGPLLSWKIYDGIKKSTKQPVSVFIFEKKSLEKMPKRQKEQIFDILKGGCKQLTKLRHPRFLTIEHGVEESRESLAFATEPVFASLANVFGEHHNMPQDHELKDYELYDVERKYGIMQLCEALSFLHEKASLIHGNVTPESIVINKSGAWKLAGLYFTVTKDHPQGVIWESKKHPLTRPELNYLAPERITGAPGDSNLVASDMFSCGVLIHALHNNGKPLYDYGDNLTSYRRVMEQNTHMAKLKIPGSLADHCRALVNIAPTSRMDADDVIKTNFFEDIGAITLQYLDSLFQKDNVEKSRFFKHVHKVISNLPKRVIVQRVLTCLVTELTNSDMIPFVLPNILLIAEDLSQEEYMSLIFPHIKPLFALEEPVQILLIFMQKMELILKLTPTDEVNSFVLPLLYRALESSQYEIQEICLSILPNHTENIEYSYIKNNIIPRIKALCLDTTALSVRINCLVCLGKMLPIIDKLTVMDLILPMLQEIPSREAGVLMSILGIYKTTFEHKRLGFDLEHLARVAIPFLTPLCIESCLNANQFGQYNNLLKDMFGRIESEQSAKLKQLGEMQEETATSINIGNNAKDNKAVQQIDSMLNKLEKLWDGSDAKNLGNVTSSNQDLPSLDPITSSSSVASSFVTKNSTSTTQLNLNGSEGKLSDKVASSTIPQQKKSLNDLQAQQNETRQTMTMKQGILQPTMPANHPSSPPVLANSMSSAKQQPYSIAQRNINQRNSSTSSTSSSERLTTPPTQLRQKQTLQQLQPLQRETQQAPFSSVGTLQPTPAGNLSHGSMRLVRPQNPQTSPPTQNSNLQQGFRMPTANDTQGNPLNINTSSIPSQATNLSNSNNVSSTVNVNSSSVMAAPLSSSVMRPSRQNDSFGSFGMGAPRQPLTNQFNTNRPTLNQRSQSFDQSFRERPPLFNTQNQNFANQPMSSNTFQQQQQGNIMPNRPAQNIDQFMMQQFSQRGPISSTRPTNPHQLQNPNVRQQFPGNPNQMMNNMASQQQRPLQRPNMQQPPTGMGPQRPMQPLIPQSAYGRSPLQSTTQTQPINQNVTSQNMVDLKDIFG